MGFSIKQKESRIKLPLKEWAYIWLDRFAKGEYPEEIYNDAYHYLTVNVTEAKGSPHFLALTALYTACMHNNKQMDVGRLRKILKAYVGNKFREGPGQDSKLLYTLKQRAKTWKQIQQ